MTSLGSDHADRRCWQQEGMVALLDLLANASPGGLPPIPWTVLTVGALLGRAESSDHVGAWAGFLAAPVTCVPTIDGSDAHRCDTQWRTVPVTIIYS
jgi:hypothetical protein